MIDLILRWLANAGQGVLRRIANVFICVDQLAFSLLTLGSSAPDETISAAAYRLEQQGKLAGRIFRPLIDTLFFFQPHHCRLAHEAELKGWQRPKGQA